MGEKAKHPAVILAALMLSLGTIVGLFAPTKADMAECKTRISVLESSMFTAKDRERLVRVEAGLVEIKSQLARLRK
jgi:hypothetical protein